MVNYTCYRCGYTTHIKTLMVRHFSRKHSCDAKINDIKIDVCKEYILKGLSYQDYLEEINKVSNGFKQDGIGLDFAESKSKVSLESANSKSKVSLESVESKCKSNNLNFECLYCSKVYIHKQSLHKHYKTCKEKKEDETVKQSMSDLVKLLNEKDKYFKEELEKRDKQINERDSQINELIKKAGINNSTITQNIQNNIKLLSYGKTDISHLTDNDYLGCLKHKNFCIPYLIEKIHFDKNKPENHNIYISNLKNKYVMMYDKRKWKTKNRDDAIDKLIGDKEILMESKLDEWEEKGGMNPNLRRTFNIYIETKDHKKVITQIKDDIELMLYNNKDLIKKNK